MLFFMFIFPSVFRFISVRASLSVLFDMHLMYYVTFFRGFFRHCTVLRMMVSSHYSVIEDTDEKEQGDYCPAVNILTIKS